MLPEALVEVALVVAELVVPNAVSLVFDPHPVTMLDKINRPEMDPIIFKFFIGISLLYS